MKCFFNSYLWKNVDFKKEMYYNDVNFWEVIFMDKLLELREQLDAIDKQVVELYEKRMAVCEQVGEIKIDAGRKIFDKQREKEKLAAVTANAKDEFHKKGITELFEQLMSMSRKLQYQILAKEDNKLRLPFQPVETLFDSDIKVVFQGNDFGQHQPARFIFTFFVIPNAHQLESFFLSSCKHCVFLLYSTKYRKSAVCVC